MEHMKLQKCNCPLVILSSGFVFFFSSFIWVLLVLFCLGILFVWLVGWFGLCYLESNTHICRSVTKNSTELLDAAGEKHDAFWEVFLLE